MTITTMVTYPYMSYSDKHWMLMFVIWVERWSTLIEDKDLRIKIGKAAREKAEREFSLDIVV